MNAIQPISFGADTVTLSRSDWDALIRDKEDRQDAASIARHKASVSAGKAVSYSSEETDRLLDGTPALTIWRERAGLTQKDLATVAGVSQSYVNEIEKSRKPGSAATLAKLANVLGVSVERLLD